MIEKVKRKAHKLGAIILYCNIPKQLGRLTYYGNKPYIFVHSKLSEERQVQVILHELQHIERGDIDNCTYNVTFSAKSKIEHETDFNSLLEWFDLVQIEEELPENLNYVQYAECLGFSHNVELVREVIEYKLNSKNKFY
ncbi:hypothetical protein FACS1894192_00540 [Bacilli bacterium]|nr:hypothetical protein FACS1894192_00540 [Bacilli bacterium]